MMEDAAKTKEALLQELAELRRSLDELQMAGGIIEKRFQSLIENSFDAIVILDREAVVRYVSPGGQHLLGYSADETIDRPSFDFVHADDVDKARDIFSRLVERGGIHHTDLKLQRKDGATRIVECVAQNLLADPVVKGVVLNYRDITERKKAEDALRLSEEKFSKAFQSSPDSITLTEIGTGQFIEVNEGFEALTGYTRDDIVGKTAVELGIWGSLDERADILTQLLEEGSIRHYEVQIRRKDAEIRSCLISADTIPLQNGPCMVAVTRDITDHRQAELLLWEIAERLKLEREESNEKDIALRQVLAHIDKEKTAYQHEVSSSVENLLAPVLRKLKKDGSLDKKDIQRLEEGVHAIANESRAGADDRMAKLTPREIDICELIKTGLSSKEIAEKLGLSPQTVQKHRQLIRRKLQLSHKDINLSSFLRTR